MAVVPFDWKINLTANSDGTVGFDLALDRNGDLAKVSGPARLVQMVTLWLMTPQGSNPFQPLYGNPFFAQLTRPTTPQDLPILEGMLQQAESAFLAEQAADAASGNLSLDELVDHFEVDAVTIPTPGVLVVHFTIVTSAAVRATAIASFTSTTGG